jgi:hypothetical protein
VEACAELKAFVNTIIQLSGGTILPRSGRCQRTGTPLDRTNLSTAIPLALRPLPFTRFSNSKQWRSKASDESERGERDSAPVSASATSASFERAIDELLNFD